MIERNLLDQTKDLRPPQRDVQSNFGDRESLAMEEQRRIAERRAEQGLSQNERVGGMQRRNDAQPIRDRNNLSQPAILLPNYAPGGKFYRGSSGSINMPADPYRDRLARLPDLSQPALRQQFQGNNSADAQPTRQNDEDSKLLSFRQLQNNLEPADAQPININTNPIRPGGNQGGGRNPSQTYQNQENRSFSNSYGNSYGNSMSGYQPQYGSRGGFGMQQPRYGGGMGIMGLQSPFGGYGMQSPFGSYGGGMQQPMYGGGMQSPFGSYGMQQPMYGGMQQGYGMQSPYGGYGMQQPQYQSSPFSPQFGGGIGSMFPGMGGGYGGGYGQPPQYGGGYGQQPSYGGGYGGGMGGGNFGGNYGGNMGGGYGQQPPSYGGMGGGFGQPMPQPMPIDRPMPARPPIMDNYRPVNTRPAPMLMQTQGPDNIGGIRPAIMQTQGPDNIGTQGPENLGFGRIGNDVVGYAR
jgi:hypothetical protein